MHVLPYMFIFEITTLLAMVVAVFAWRQRHVPSALALEWLAWSVAAWALFYTLELLAPRFEAKLLAARLQYLGIICVPLAWLTFTRQYAGDHHWPSRHKFALLSIIPLITLGLVWTNDLHGLVWSAVSMDPDSPLPVLDIDHGQWFWVHTLYSYILMVIGSLSLVRVIRRSTKLYRWEIAVLLICTLAPWLGSTLYLLRLSPIYPLDLTPLGFLISLLALAWLLFHFGLPGVGTAHNAIPRSLHGDTIEKDTANQLFDDRHTVLNLITLGLLSSIAISMRGGIAWASAHLPPELITMLESFISTAAAVLSLLLLWQISNRLAAARSQTRAANAALRESEARYRAISDLTTDTIYSIHIGDDGQTELEWVSESFASATGYTLEDLRQRDGWLKILHPDDRTIDQEHDVALRAGQSDMCEYRIITKQGQVRWMRDYARPIWNAEHTHVVRILGAAQDITKHKHAETTQHFLAEASKLLASSLDYEITLVNVAQLAIPQLADWCIIHLIDDDYVLRRVALTFADPAKQPLADELQRDYPLEMDAPYSYPHVIRTGQPELIPEVSDQGLQMIAHNPRHLELLRVLGFCSTLNVPLIARNRTIGAIMLGTAESGRRYAEADLRIAEELASRVALAVDNARLFAERTSSEQRLHRQNEELTALHDMTLGLIDRLDVDNLLSALVIHAGGLLDTAHGYLYVFDQETNELVVRVASGIFVDQIGYRLKRGQGLAGRVWETGQPLAIENYLLWSNRQPDLDPMQLQAIASVPIRAGADLGGVLGLAYLEQTRTFSQAEIELLQRFADMASLALENARLYNAAQQELAERRHTEAALLDAEAGMRAAKEQAEAATRAKSEFLAQMSHDMRTPISSAIGITRLLEGTNLDAGQRELVNIIRISGDVLLTLVNNFLDLAKIESGKLTLEHHAFVLQDCIEGVFDLVAGDVIAKQIDLAYTIDPHIPAILVGDQQRLQQILANLLSNAAKFTATGGILLAANGEPTSTGQYEIHMSVADTGVGIPPEWLEHVFTPFEQVDIMNTRPTSGTGLGLAIAKQLSELMGGHMWLESAVGQGSTFHFTICVDPASDLSFAAAPAADAIEITALRGKQLLIVDHNVQSRHAFSVYAQELGMHTTLASTANQALELAEAGAHFDLAVVELRDATIEGMWLGTTLREHYRMPDLHLIVLVPLGFRDDEIYGEIFDVIVHKPLKLSQLREALLRSIAGFRAAEMGQATPSYSDQWQHGAPLPRILLVEDDHANRQLGIRILQQLGYPHTAVSTGSEALAAIEREHYELVLLDVQLPDIDGLQVARRIRERGVQHWQPYLIALTADTQPSTRAACMSAGMDAYLSKPLQMSDLHAALGIYHNSVTTTAAPLGPRAFVRAAPPSAISVSAAGALDPQALERLRSLFGPHRARLDSLIEHYCADTAILPAKMKQAAAENDLDTLRLSLHQLKSSSAIVAALRLANVCKQFETALDSNTNDDWHIGIQAIEAEIMLVQTALQAEISIGHAT